LGLGFRVSSFTLHNPAYGINFKFSNPQIFKFPFSISLCLIKRSMDKYLIVGLGNIGEEYANTRHNIGFIVADALANELGAKFTIERHAFKTEAKLKNKLLIILKPTTFMNLSGKAVKYWLDKEKIPLENLLVITDDVDLDLGVLRSAYQRKRRQPQRVEPYYRNIAYN
jgi:hypothetical protein